ncbi:MAG: hypothetical protein AAGE52_13910 [Myxococcota bacterium]
MITIDAPISFLVGAALATARRDPEKPEVRNRDRLLHKGLLFQSTILTPVILFFMARFPDWEWNYFFDARAFFFDSAGPWGFLVLTIVISLINLSFVAGFRFAEAAIRQGAPERAQQTVLGTGGIVLLTMAVLYDRSLHVGTFEEYQEASAQLIFLHGEFMVVLGVAGAVIAAGIATVLRSERGGPVSS